MKRRFVLSILYIAAGALLFVLGCINNGDGSLCGAGGGLLGVGAVFLIRNVKYRTNPEYKEKTDIAENDERNRYISLKSWAWTGYIMVLFAAVSALVFYIAGRGELALLSCCIMGLIAFLYLVNYLILQRRY